MNLYHLRYFLRLSELEHYTKAAESLNITQPTLSYAMTTLEEEIGVKLFEKDGRNIQLTKDGQTFASKIKKAVALIDQATDQMQQIQKGSGHINIGLLRTLSQKIVPQLVKSYIESKPEDLISFEFHHETGMSIDILDSLAQKKIDIAFCSYMDGHSDIEFIPFAKQELVLITPPDHPLGKMKSCTIEQTLNYPQIWFSKRSGVRPTIDQVYADFNQHPQIAYEVDEDEAVAGLVSQGFGIAIIPAFPTLSTLNIRIIPLSNVSVERIYYMAYLNNIYHSPVVEDFIGFVKQNNLINSMSDA